MTDLAYDLFRRALAGEPIPLDTLRPAPEHLPSDAEKVTAYGIAVCGGCLRLRREIYRRSAQVWKNGEYTSPKDCANLDGHQENVALQSYLRVFAEHLAQAHETTLLVMRML